MAGFYLKQIITWTCNGWHSDYEYGLFDAKYMYVVYMYMYIMMEYMYIVGSILIRVKYYCQGSFMVKC